MLKKGVKIGGHEIKILYFLLGSAKFKIGQQTLLLKFIVFALIPGA